MLIFYLTVGTNLLHELCLKVVNKGLNVSVEESVTNQIIIPPKHRWTNEFIRFFVSLLIYLFFPHILYPDYSFSSFFLCPGSPQSIITPRSIPFPYPFRKRQESQGYQSNMTYHVATRLGTSLHTKAEQGNPVKGKWSSKQVKEPKTFPDFTVRNQTRTTRCTTITYIQKTNVCRLLDFLLSIYELL